MAIVDVLLPTCDRLESLIMTLSGLAAQSVKDIHLVVSDQGRAPAAESPVVQSLLRVIRAGSPDAHVEIVPQGAVLRHRPSSGTSCSNSHTPSTCYISTMTC